LYCFPKIDLKQFDFEDDDAFILGLLEEKHILTVAGNGFNYPTKDHFRIVFLPPTEMLGTAMDSIADFMQTRRV
jgi:alanine-synthesizing transaminase